MSQPPLAKSPWYISAVASCVAVPFEKPNEWPDGSWCHLSANFRVSNDLTDLVEEGDETFWR
jgi:hypothetical protein